jgi:DNA-binding MarR family transcriptional regulator
MTSPLDDPRLTAMGLLAETYAGLMTVLSGQIADHGLAPLEFEVLMRLARTPGHTLRMADLAAQVTMSASGLTRVIDRLERQGFVERRICSTDRRGTNAVLTDQGLAKVGEVVPEHLKLIERWFTGLLSPDQLDAIQGTLRIVRDVVRPGAVSGVRPVAR